jgi:signal transduction histidine kinase
VVTTQRGEETAEARLWTRPHAVTIAARLLLLGLVSVLSVVAAHRPAPLAWVGLLALAAVPAILAPAARTVGALVRTAEVVLTCLGAASVAALAGHGSAASAMLPYLVVPMVAAALYRRSGEIAFLLGLAAVTILAAGAADDQILDSGYLAVSSEWLLLSVLSAMVALTVQRTLRERPDQPQPYAEATRLLTQLRSVARQLPGATLDPGGIAEHLLEEVRAVVPVHRSAVLSASGGGRLVVLAQSGADRVDWETTLDSDTGIADAWASQQPQVTARSQARSRPGSEVSALIVPLVAGVRTIGLVVVEADAPAAYPPSALAEVTALTAPAALRLEAALLFDEVRSLATNEERQRLAREIHDGVAQELVMVGYGIDNALAALPGGADQAADELRLLRNEVTRVITELRLSLFELRSEVDRHGGLAAAIAEYARTVGASAGLRVHLSLDESTARLPAATEAELLRIAQEAITNARKHAGAENLWVTCAVDPPFAQVEVSDDGRGIGDQRSDGRYGLAIMAERAERIRGRLEIQPREPSGTTVAVVLGSVPRRGSVSPPEGEKAGYVHDLDTDDTHQGSARRRP